MLNKLILNTQTKRIVLDCTQILYFQADKSYTKIFLKDGYSLTVSNSLGKIGKLLPPDCFCRCHRSYIVNKSEAHSFDKLRKCLQLKCGVEIPVSFRNISYVTKEIFKNYLRLSSILIRL